jgi:acyl-CoA synthetase (AMP-forming)/AMP-acid ligase II
LATGWLRTKDLGYYEKGSISVIGNVSPIIKNQQEKVFPSKSIEEFLEIETVRKACILPLLHAKNVQRPCLFLLKNDTLVKYHETPITRIHSSRSFMLLIGDLKSATLVREIDSRQLRLVGEEGCEETNRGEISEFL